MKERLGGRLRVANSGGAPLSPRDHASSSTLSTCSILEGYGLTECTTACSVNRPDAYRFGTVGQPLPGVEVRLAEDGELLIRSPTVFAGYYKDEEATREVLDEDGWLRTGDIADDRRGRLHHDHRPQEGHPRHRRRQERRAAEPRERAEDVAVRLPGARRRRPAAVRRRADHARRAGARQVAGRGRRRTSSELVQGDRRRASTPHRSRYEQIKRFEILPRDFSADEGEITPTLKLRRRVVQEHFADAIERTFLFTDIEGSTRLLKELGRDGYAEAARRARSGCCAPRSPPTRDRWWTPRATRSSSPSAPPPTPSPPPSTRSATWPPQRWPEGADVKVRMGLHTGEPRVGEQRYVGIGVHRAARIGAAGHGGQVLLSSTTRGAGRGGPPPGVSIRDLGERRLKDIDQPQHLYQLDVDGLQSEFAQLRTLDVELRRKRRRMYAGAALIGVPRPRSRSPSSRSARAALGSGVDREGERRRRDRPGLEPGHGRRSPSGRRPGAIAFGSGSLWVANRDDQNVSRIDPERRASTKRSRSWTRRPASPRRTAPPGSSARTRTERLR